MQESDKIRIGTRKSKLALWQANHLKNKIEELGLMAELVLIDSQGDLDRTSELDQFTQTGIFTKSLDAALLRGEIDLAIHSLKDYPTVPIQGIKISTFDERESPYDVLVKNQIVKDINESKFKIATGSIRRKAQWKHKFSDTQFHSLRGNVPTRLEKMYDSDWDGIIMAYAGLKRLGRLDENCITLDWMVPAPAQGILGITYLHLNKFAEKLILQLQIPEVELCAQLERKFLNKLEGGCSAPIGALAKIEGQVVHFKGSLHSVNGLQGLYVDKRIDKNEAFGEIDHWVKEILKTGGEAIMNNINKK